MPTQRFGIATLLIALTSTTLTGCALNELQASSNTSPLSGTLNAIGSSAQSAAQTVWASGFQSIHTSTLINYDPQGSGAGRKNFLSGASNFAGSDSALNAEELTSTFTGCAPGSTGIDLPVYISPIVLAYNISGITDLILNAETIAGIFSGVITNWSDPKLTSLNPGVSLPNATITVVHRSDDSGTTKNFTEYLAATAPDVWNVPSSQTFPFPIGDAAKGTSGVATATLNSSNSITYIDESGAAGLSLAKLRSEDGQINTVTPAGAAAAVAASPLAQNRPANDIVIKIDRSYTQNNAWPLVLVSYVIACQTYPNPDTGQLVREYINYLVSPHAQDTASKETGSAPLDPKLATQIRVAAASIN